MENEMISKRQLDWRLGTINLSCQAEAEIMERLAVPQTLMEARPTEKDWEETQYKATMKALEIQRAMDREEIMKEITKILNA